MEEPGVHLFSQNSLFHKFSWKEKLSPKIQDPPIPQKLYNK